MHMSLKLWGETHEIPHHNQADFEPWLEYATEGQSVGGIPLENTSEGPQYHPQLLQKIMFEITGPLIEMDSKILLQIMNPGPH